MGLQIHNYLELEETTTKSAPNRRGLGQDTHLARPIANPSHHPIRHVTGGDGLVEDTLLR